MLVIGNNTFFRIFIENPFKTWWKARKYFKRPKVTIQIGLFKDNFRFNSAKILDINIHDLEWKDKWNSPRHEDNPLIFISLFKYFWIYIEPHIKYYNEFGEKKDGDLYYWEYLLNYLYYKKHLRCYSSWTSDSQLYQMRIYNKEEEKYKNEPYSQIVPVVAISLNRKGIKELKLGLECCALAKK